jgi:hypothetical protein
MRNRNAAEVNAYVEARIAQIEQMTLDQIAAFRCKEEPRQEKRAPWIALSENG